MAINFPDSSQSPFTDSNGTVWTWQTNKWVAEGSGASIDLQAVTDAGNTTTNDIITTGDVNADNVVATGDIQSTSQNGGQLAGMRNLIINGAMQIAQRGTEETGVTDSGYRTCDRFQAQINSLGTWTVQQSTDSPDGFANSLRMLCTTAEPSPAGNSFCFFAYFVEGFDCQRLLDTGTTTHPLRLSFWVKSNRTGDASVGLLQSANSNRMFTTSYNIVAADTWEHKVIEVPVDTAAVFNNDNGRGLQIEWWLNSGSNYTSGTHSAGWVAIDDTERNSTNLGVGQAVDDEFFLTGVQLETGEAATPFEHRPIGTELALCQRYFISDTAVNAGLVYFGSFPMFTIMLPTTMRVAPTTVTTSSASAFSSMEVGGSNPQVNYTATSVTTVVNSSSNIRFQLEGGTWSPNQPTSGSCILGSVAYTATAEL